MSASELLRNPRVAWEPYQPRADDPWDLAKAAHLHRQAGFGATWGQIKRDVAEGYEASLRRVLHGDTHGPSGQPAAEYEETVACMEDSARRRPSLERVQLFWLYRFLLTPFPLQEKMTLMWHGHYATSNDKARDPLLMLDQNQAQRSLWRDRISRLHLRMLRDPAMLRWLDGVQNKRSSPNENLGREFLELFALGEGNYREQDIRETARALTGWQDASGDSEFTFLPADHDNATKTILGATGNWTDEDVVRIVCRQPAAARHIARRLFRTFVADTVAPSDALLEPLAQAMRVDSDVDAARGVEVILRSRLFHAGDCRGLRVKTPVEYVIGALRAGEVFQPPPDLADMEIHLTKMGQRLFYPPNVAGWPDGLRWLRDATLLARANFAATFADPASPAGPAHLLVLVLRHDLKQPEQWLDALAFLLLGLPLTDAKKKETLDLVRTGPSRAAILGNVARHLLGLAEAQVC